ncbi:50S ribosomal protein L18 [Desulfuromonas acetoxidans]|uniref:Large ribosomal subunit protein uL18 n=1 Tax=Desulfuromonas acetoxidans (strain DSM 684 / 11070) TaxID=281689 RepID=Q1JXY7_DESA6|nr:50S ribosomal protein L18 [Desulfuromonas acetoxidans]EAT15209.1 ribosomal protein L18 [Desulfuromonas acetoxidans DSM 684]MBF0644037.1 50S ribosomal protein L18 [Desulfuromonas acetoxidans]NVD23275.1 50S ribosomal protein L18 [Desulfuromonas acetoxidans]NVE15484.1 50S ribosomal protein L18 [Desulfuromonas acetoxidans]
MAGVISRAQSRKRRQARVRRKVVGTAARPRLCVFRSAKHIYAQIIEDTTGTSLVSVSSQNQSVADGLNYTGNVAAAKAVGEAIAKMALEKDIKEVVFDRNGYVYHGRVKALADSAREAGLVF